MTEPERSVLPLAPLLARDRAPDFSGTDLEGTSITLYDWRPSKPIVLVFALRFDAVTAAHAVALHRALGPQTAMLGVVLAHDDECVTVDDVPIVVDDGTTVLAYLGASPPPSGAAVVVDRARRIVALAPLGHSTTPGVVVRAASKPLANGRVPALVVPDVLEPELCRLLIAACPDPGETEIDGDLAAAVVTRLDRRLRPEIRRHLCSDATGFAALRVSCDEPDDAELAIYDRSDPSGRADLAICLELDTAAYEGGRCQFMEFEPPWPAAQTGSALVVSNALVHTVTPVTSGRRHVAVTRSRATAS